MVDVLVAVFVAVLVDTLLAVVVDNLVDFLVDVLIAVLVDALIAVLVAVVVDVLVDFLVDVLIAVLVAVFGMSVIFGSLLHCVTIHLLQTLESILAAFCSHGVWKRLVTHASGRLQDFGGSLWS